MHGQMYRKQQNHTHKYPQLTPLREAPYLPSPAPLPQAEHSSQHHFMREGAMSKQWVKSSMFEFFPMKPPPPKGCIANTPPYFVF